MRFKVLALFIIAVLFGVSACSKDSNNYRYPLKVGNSWTYRRTISYSNDQPARIDIIQVCVDSTLIAPGGQRCYRLRTEETNNGQQIVTYQCVAYLDDGLNSLGYWGWGFGLKGSEPEMSLFASGARAPQTVEMNWFVSPHLLIPKNLSPGTTWIQQHNANWLEVHYLIEDPQVIVTDIGSFDSHVKRSYVGMFEQYLHDYYSSKGLVRKHYVVEDIIADGEGGVKTVSEETDIRLIAYDLK